MSQIKNSSNELFHFSELPVLSVKFNSKSAAHFSTSGAALSSVQFTRTRYPACLAHCLYFNFKSLGSGAYLFCTCSLCEVPHAIIFSEMCKVAVSLPILLSGNSSVLLSCPNTADSGSFNNNLFIACSWERTLAGEKHYSKPGLGNSGREGVQQKCVVMM